MRMEAASSMRTPRARNASFDHARRYAVIASQLSRVFNFCIQGQIRLMKSLVIGSQVGSPFQVAPCGRYSPARVESPTRWTDHRCADSFGHSIEHDHGLATAARSARFLDSSENGLPIVPIVVGPHVPRRIDADVHLHVKPTDVAAGGEMGSPIFVPGGQVPVR